MIYFIPLSRSFISPYAEFVIIELFFTIYKTLSILEHRGPNPMDEGPIIGQGVGGRINLIVCDYISSIKKELFVC